MSREYRLSHIFSFYTLFVMIIFTAILLIWTYSTTTSVLVDEINLSFEQRHRTARNIIREEYHFIKDFASSLNQSDIFGKSMHRKDNEAVDLIVKDISKGFESFPDILIISDFEKNVIINQSSPIFSMDEFENVITANTLDLLSRGRIIDFHDGNNRLTAMLQASDIISKSNGRVIGFIFTGTVLENNFSLLKRIKDETGSDIVTISDGSRLIATTDKRDSDLSKNISMSYNQDQAERFSYREVNQQGYMTSSSNIYLDEKTSPRITLAVKSTPFEKLKKDMLQKIIIIIILLFVFISISIFLTAKLTSGPLASLVNFANEVESEMESAGYKHGQIREFNEVGHRMESMVQTILSADEKFRQFSNATWEAIVIHQEGVLIEANDQFFTMFGYDREQDKNYITGKNILNILYSGESLSIVRNQVEKNKTNSYEVVANKKDGSEIVVEIRVRNMEYKKMKVRVAAIRDITEKKNMASIMVQTEKMMSVGGLAAGMAHEINNPLAGMIQTANVLSNRLIKGINIKSNRQTAESLGTDLKMIRDYMEARQIPKLLDSMKESGKRISQIVENMLSFSRSKDDAKTSHDINAILERTIKLAHTDFNLKSQYDFKSINIVTDFSEDIPMLMCEKATLQQVFLNILRNGAQAMHEANTVTPRFRLRTRFNRNEKTIDILIEDNGPGMDEETQKRIFEPFFTTKPVGEGTGLGLSVSYFIIKDNHNGELNVCSTPGEGTVFEIKIPIDNAVERSKNMGN